MPQRGINPLARGCGIHAATPTLFIEHLKEPVGVVWLNPDTTPPVGEK
ncbi:hypothetical protein CCP3SC15_370002 [Gammaproteobacteria bacterium]